MKGTFSMNTTQPVTVESLMLANHAESVNGLLYISGGGCNIHRRMVSPGGAATLSHLGLALIIAVPWHQTNLIHNLIIEFRDEDANVIANIDSKLNMGRSPGLRPGTIQYANVGLPIDIVFLHPGDYEIVARIEGGEGSERRWTFQVQDIPQMAAMA
jgi:Family of unknown function (DUF6941)